VKSVSSFCERNIPVKKWLDWVWRAEAKKSLIGFYLVVNFRLTAVRECIAGTLSFNGQTMHRAAFRLRKYSRMH
jgi:hypothetical protein